MHRLPLYNLLEKYAPQAPEEKLFKEQILHFIKEHAHCFDRSLILGHITASAWLLDRSGSHALLMHHAKLDNWFQPGGHCDGNPDVCAVAVKEAQEESGIQGIKPVSQEIFDIDIHQIPANAKEPAHYHYDIRFLLQVTSDEQVRPNAESKELRWIRKNPADLPTQNKSVVRMFNKWLTLSHTK